MKMTCPLLLLSLQLSWTVHVTWTFCNCQPSLVPNAMMHQCMKFHPHLFCRNDQQDAIKSEYTLLESVLSTVRFHDENLLPSSKLMNSSIFGYLMICRPSEKSTGYDCCSSGIVVAEPCPPPVLHEQGSFLYHVCSANLISVLNGPALDAPTAKTVLYPGQIIHIECKVQLPNFPNKNPGDNDDDNDSHNVTFSRLKHHHGWIPDQQPVLAKPWRTQEGEEQTRTIIVLVKEITSSESCTFVSSTSSTAASTTSTHSNFGVHAILSQPTPHWSRRYRRHPVQHIFQPPSVASSSGSHVHCPLKSHDNLQVILSINTSIPHEDEFSLAVYKSKAISQEGEKC